MQGLSTQLIVAAAAAAISVASIAAVVTLRLLSSQSASQRRLRESVRHSDGASANASSGGTLASLRPLVPKSVRQMSGVERRLASAGYRHPALAPLFVATQFVLPCVAIVAAFAWFGFADRRIWVGAGIGALVGFLIPGLVLDHLVSKRRQAIRNGLPDVMDLLIVCLEAGSSLDQSVVKATEELDIAYPALCEELRILITETRAGKPRLEAFKNLAQRTKVDDVRALVSMLTQTDRFGTSIGQALRTLAESMRTKRQQQAEERANKLGVKLVFPLALCLFPVFFVVVLGPAMITLIRALGNATQ